MGSSQAIVRMAGSGKGARIEYSSKMTRELSGPRGTDRSTYVFSKFNEVELPEVRASDGSATGPRGRTLTEAAERRAPL